MSRTHDFAKTLPKRTPAKGRKRNSRPPYAIWATTLLLSVGFVGGLLYLSLQEKNKTEHPVVAKPKKAHVVPVKQKPRFEFYNMLPNMTVGDPLSEDANPKKATESVKTTRAAQPVLIQIAAVNQYDEADKLKAKLTLQGFDVSIKPIQTDKGRFYRVLIGPYANATLAQHDKKALSQLQYHGFLVKP